MEVMTPDDSELLKRAAQEFEDERNARAELAWHLEPRPADPMIEAAAQRRLPPGHIAFLGRQASLPLFRPDA